MAQPQLLRFVADAEYWAIIGLRLRYPVVAYVDCVDDVAHRRDAELLRTQITRIVGPSSSRDVGWRFIEIDSSIG
jgi:hypothetical protein